MAIVHSWVDAATFITPSTVFASPTDTVWGLQAIVSAENAVRLAELKARPQEQFVVLVSSLDMAESLAELSPSHRDILRKYWPGKITFLLKGRRQDKIALRWPKQPQLEKILHLLGNPLYSTSCNPHGKQPAKNLEEAKLYFPKGVLFIDGETGDTSPSTLVDLTGQPTILRQGAVSFP